MCGVEDSTSVCFTMAYTGEKIIKNQIKNKQGDSVWEKRVQAMKKFQDFLGNSLKFEDPEDVELIEIHRLPQYFITKYGKVVNRPIIVKLLIVDDKHLIFKKAKHLKSYNNKRKSFDKFLSYLFITEHLLSRF